MRLRAQPGGGLHLGIYRVGGDIAPYWPPIPKLTQPAPAVVLASPNRWIGPLRRHDVDRYGIAMRRHAAGYLGPK